MQWRIYPYKMDAYQFIVCVACDKLKKFIGGMIVMTENKSLLPFAASNGGAKIMNVWDEMHDLLEEMYGMIVASGSPKLIFDDIQQSQSSFPKINVLETDTTYGVEIAIAGFTKDDINLELKDNVLIISAEKKIEKTENEKYLRREISSRAFHRAVKFPKKIDTKSIKADYKDGIVNVELDKFIKIDEESNGLKIKIN